MKNKLSFVMLVFLVGFVIVGCGNGGKDNVTEAKASNVGVDPTAAYDKTITTTMVISDPFGKVKSPYTDSAWGKAYKDDLNVIVDVKAAISASNYQERLNTLMASDDLPDFFSVPNTMLEQLIEDDVLADMTDIYAEFASDRLKTITEANGKKALEGSMVDGKIYGIPVSTSEQSSRRIVFIRQDWLDKLNLKTPETIDDVWAVAKAFKDNKLGGENTIGIPMDKDLSSVNAIASAYGANRGIYKYDKESKKLVFSSIEPEMKEALKIINEKFEEGLIDPEFIAKDGEKVNEELKAGKAGVWFDATGANANVAYPLFGSNPEAKFIAVPIRTPSGEVASQDMPTGAGGFWVVKKGAKNPEVLLKLLNYTLNKWDSLKTDDEFALYNYNVKGQDGFNGFPIGGIPEATLRWPVNRAYYQKTGEFTPETDEQEKLNLKNLAEFEKTGKETETFTEQDYKMIDFENSQTGPGIALAEYAVGDHYVYDYNQGFGSPTIKTKKSILDKIELDTMMNIITGNKPIAEFDNFVKDWNDNGGSQIVKELNEWFNTKEGYIE